jgi:hypothetical protein
MAADGPLDGLQAACEQRGIDAFVRLSPADCTSASTSRPT